REVTSGLSPYLHFGQISPGEVARASAGLDGFLEELIVRRELAVNFVWYNDAYDHVSCLPAWAATTLAEHADDQREYTYSYDELRRADTHDPYWNAAQNEMLVCGRMHNYMRMYWGKKILEWSETPETGYHHAVLLNDTYELDGRDPNGYAGVAWCFGKHDRAWKERPIFGKVRYMNANGLKRKGDIEGYVRRVEGYGARVEG
ncbi:MAG: deoxyribodipyrimidine photolyase, partial [Methanocalculus sp. MSAO_Arc2]